MKLGLADDTGNYRAGVDPDSKLELPARGIGRAFKIGPVSDRVDELLGVTGVRHLLGVCASEEEAVQAVLASVGQAEKRRSEIH